MKNWTRREVLKSGMAVQVATAAGIPDGSLLDRAAKPEREWPGSIQAPFGPTPLRERLLLDFGWRFPFRCVRRRTERIVELDVTQADHGDTLIVTLTGVKTPV